MDTSLKGHPLPTTFEEFELLRRDGLVRFADCVSCGSVFSNENTDGRLAWRETQISGICGTCFDELTDPR